MLADTRTELVIASDIAKRLGISPQRVYVLTAGPGCREAAGMLGRSAVWRLSTVERGQARRSAAAEDAAA